MTDKGAVKPTGSMQQPLAITSTEWLLDDRRPEGYMRTTELRLKAKSRGIRYRDVVERADRHAWRTLLRKAKREGLTDEECQRIVELSAIIHRALRCAVHSTT